MQHESITLPHNAGSTNRSLGNTVDRFARIAARLCNVPAARLRLIPPHHEDAIVTAPLEEALYALTLVQPSLFIVRDVCEGNTVALPLCHREGAPFRFFAGVPLHASAQQVLGVLYVLDYVPRTLSDADQDALIALGQAASEQIALLQSYFPAPSLQSLPLEAGTLTAPIVSGECVVSIDHEGIVHEWNPAAEETFGYKRAQAVGRFVADLIIPPHLREQHRRGMKHYLSTGDGPILHRHTEVTALRADGTEIPIELVVVPAPAGPGQPPLFTGYIRDMSAQQQDRAALQQVYDHLVQTHNSEASQRAQAEAAIAFLNQSLLNANQQLVQAYDTTIEGWARALDLRDKETEGHCRRVTEVAVQLARRLGMCPNEQIHMRRGALLHDIGKMGVPDHILLKPGPLTDEEWNVMRRHPEYARDMLMPIDFLRPALDIPYSHHEKWDGNGYPQGLQGKQIPLAARIFSVVDVWDALRSDRPYRPAWTEERVRAYLLEQAGVVQQFVCKSLEPRFLHSAEPSGK